jgi:hypothetical protein
MVFVWGKILQYFTFWAIGKIHMHQLLMAFPKEKKTIKAMFGKSNKLAFSL